MRRCAALCGIGESYLRAIIRNEEAIKVRVIGNINAVNYYQVRRFLLGRGVKLGPSYENRKGHLRIVRKPAVNE